MEIEQLLIRRTKLHRLRAWLRSDMRVLRWVFLGLYLCVLAGFAVAWLSSSGLAPIVPFILLVCQGLLILGGGTIRLCEPVHPRRLVMPVAVAGAMFALLLAGFFIAMTELFRLDPDKMIPYGSVAATWWGLLGASWLAWALGLWVYVYQRPRYGALGRLVGTLVAGSLAELLATIPAHIIVSRRPGCLVGIGTMIGLIAGVCVMVFALGPAVVLLFLRPRLRRERAALPPTCDKCGYDLRASKDRCPECGTPFKARAS